MRLKTAPNRLIKTAIPSVINLSLGFNLTALRKDNSQTTASATETLTNWLERRREADVQVDPVYRAAHNLTSRR
ncbi:MAG TPA: hypothetical protein VF131_05995 [Blastocatellia bacterium]|nr:hypothetical protein [Blastocatellia bacterium]